MASAPGALQAQLDTAVPGPLELGRGNALFALGSCDAQDGRSGRLEIDVAGRRSPVMAEGMPRLDGTAYRSGFWAIVPLPAELGPGSVELRLVATAAGGAERAASLAELELVQRPPEHAREAERSASIAICMATHNPDAGLFAAQIDSIRAQSESDWICLISDDASGADAVAAMKEVIGEDPRFRISRSDRRLGFYRNFERALGMAPASAELVAIADQDDRWRPEKLAALREAIAGRCLAYSDQRVVGRNGTVVSETYWTSRRNNHTDLTSLLIANTVTGAACMLRRELLDDALPFPPAPGEPYHDHWLALVALCTGGIAYVDRPLYDYVQHRGAALGHTGANTVPGRGALAPLRRLLRGERPAVGWRSLYFYEYCRLALFSTVLLLRCGERMGEGRRRELESFLRADRSAAGAARLGVRSGRSLWGRNETLGAERRLAAGLLWRRLLPLLPEPIGRRAAHDTAFPDRTPREMREAE
jgi:glycosyltransferase involved in cell wall biosynthesis